MPPAPRAIRSPSMSAARPSSGRPRARQHPPCRRRGAERGPVSRLSPPSAIEPAMPARILLALDTSDVATAVAQARAVGPAVDGIKLGLEFFVANGPAGVREVQAEGQPLFLDLKFHDIPNTVAGAIRSAIALRPMMLNVHAGGGPEMLRRAAEAVREAGETRPLLIGVTVMTSLGDDDLAAVGQQLPALDQVRRLAGLAQRQGCDGVVCSAREIAALKRDCGPDFKLVVPGIRPAGSEGRRPEAGSRTPAEASALGADFLVIGRPITGATDSRQRRGTRPGSARRSTRKQPRNEWPDSDRRDHRHRGASGDRPPRRALPRRAGADPRHLRHRRLRAQLCPAAAADAGSAGRRGGPGASPCSIPASSPRCFSCWWWSSCSSRSSPSAGIA